uniref:Uncharacterized protein LOC111115120 isoform X2 n=1 Tax=Crassostrea virginica TaxID=6565 RepID=A0A8B8C368_CRAVI|nr:uncharacterized protein LOC111115120 isoform X2 [Crassostrea virginica]XP_022309437.1 uncharacterized protein LOC111115120 isoform X2 [Crassostrea virginica]
MTPRWSGKKKSHLINCLSILKLTKNSCACLEDVLSLLHKTIPCGFKKNTFISMFIDNSQECLSNCSIYSTDPWYTKWKENKIYEIKNVAIQFSQTQYRFEWGFNCRTSSDYKFPITFLCEGKHFFERGIGESCINPAQCKAVNPHSTCNLPSGKCSCQEGYLWNSTTCIEARGLDSYCTESKQCQEINADSACNSVSSKCECRQGFIQHFNSCLPARKLGEPCDDPLQCLVTSQNSTCNDTSNVCECEEGYLEVLSICTKGRVLLDEMCESYSHSDSSGHDKDFENVCSALSAQIFNPSRVNLKNNYSGIIAGAVLGGVLFGIVVCAAVFFLIIQRLKKSHDTQQMSELADASKQIQGVQVSGDLSSRKVAGTNRRSNTEENGIYNHLHEDHIELQDQSDYDHCSPQDAPDDMYNHLDSGHENSSDYMGDYGIVN